MTTPFRNVEVDESLPLAEWPFEALVTLVERGSIRDWARVSAAIKGDPWGEVARQIEDLLAYSRPYGIAGLLERAISRARSDREEAERAEVARQVREFVRRSGLSTAHFATPIGTSRSRLSTYRSGKVTPSAALVTRMSWLVDRCAQASGLGSAATYACPDRAVVGPGDLNLSCIDHAESADQDVVQVDKGRNAPGLRPGPHPPR